MSGHETIRVLEVEVDTPLPSSVSNVKLEGKAEEAAAQAVDHTEGRGTQDGPTLPQSSRGFGKSCQTAEKKPTSHDFFFTYPRHSWTEMPVAAVVNMKRYDGPPLFPLQCWVNNRWCL